MSKFYYILAAAAYCVLLLAPDAVHAQTLITNAREARDIDANDTWIAVLGDSFASGEGNPMIPGQPVNDWKWLDDDKCHRSIHAWPYRVFRRVAMVSRPGRHVFLSFHACSGASISKGLLGPYKPMWFDGLVSKTLEPQINALADEIRAAGRRPDVLLISAGGNDADFSEIVKDCLWLNCPGGKAGSAADVRRKIERLADHYDDLDEAIDGLGIPAHDVYLMQYPNPLRGRVRLPNGRWSESKVRAGCWALSPKRAWEWADGFVVAPLQDQVRRAAERHRWTLIDDHLEPFRRHSYCPRKPGGVNLPGVPTPSWWVSVKNFRRQWGVGAFHPNNRGHKAMTEAALVAINRDIP